MRKILSILTVLTVAISGFFVPVPVFAEGSTDCDGGISDSSCNKACDSISDDTLKAAAGCDVDSNDTLPKHLLNIINFVISAVGIIAVIVIVMGGQRYLTSNGDPGKAKQAKDMILYAVVAIVVAVLAFAIVNFVSAAITSNANKGISAITTITI